MSRKPLPSPSEIRPTTSRLGLRPFLSLASKTSRAIHYFGTDHESFKHHLSSREVSRILVASLVVGSGMYLLVDTIGRATGLTFPAPADAALAATMLTTVLDTSRRLGHGATAPRARLAEWQARTSRPGR